MIKNKETTEIEAIEIQQKTNEIIMTESKEEEEEEEEQEQEVNYILILILILIKGNCS